ncbi:hypothetical protein RDV89_19650 [Nocardioides zeae]|uniref:Uncharacterized protein n=1 Tax=Nocardioides imazamoxiresistens TaxID=3231893 RepID=A0ABU3Q1B8_9ACTN|nr:hypothetical protein [Nocardioides zeae]MDT9595312.1 hypothetical protein [Nocardioides zeae]
MFPSTESLLAETRYRAEKVRRSYPAAPQRRTDGESRRRKVR